MTQIGQIREGVRCAPLTFAAVEPICVHLRHLPINREP